jgi:hypothetical protein
MFATIRKLVLTHVVPGLLVVSIGAYTSALILNGLPEARKPEKCKRHNRKPRNKRKKERQ